MNSAKGKPDPLNTFAGKIVEFISKRSLPMVKLEANFTPIQNLNGQEAPYPPGGGKNLLPITISTSTTSGVTFTVNNDGTISTSGTATADINKTINTTTKLVEGESYKLAGCASGSDGSNYYMRSTRGITVGSTGPGFSSVVTATSEALYLFIHISNGVNTNGLVFKPMICLSTETDYTFAPYANICPISGHDGCDVVVDGKNLLDDSTFAAGLLTSTIGADINDVVSSTRYYHSGIVPIKDTLAVTIKTLDLSKIEYAGVIAYVNDKVVWASGQNFSASVKSKTWLIPANTYEKLRINIGAPAGVVADVANTESQIEIGSTASDYEAYRGESTQITFPNTLFGGKLTVREDGTGQVDADRIMFDISTLSWVYTTNNNRFYASRPSALPDTVNDQTISDRYVYGNTAAKNNTIQPTSSQIYIKDERFTDAAALTASLSGSQTLFKLSNPVTIPLTASQINTLVGENVVWVNDSDSISVTAYGTEIT